MNAAARLERALIAASPDLETRYRAPDRHYHSLAHIERCLELFEELRNEFSDAESVEAAIWFHDAIYDSRRSDNEEQSADLAVATLRPLGIDEATLVRVHELILATKHHPASTDGDTALFIDIDLAILGAAPAQFDAYEAGVRREYAHIDDESFRSGRAAVLERFLARPQIFTMKALQSRLEKTARANLQRSIAALRQ